MENEKKPDKGLGVCLILLLAATLGINLLSAYIRHYEAGLGCAPWPDCYARIGERMEPPGETPAAALTPTDTAKQAHRGLATGLVILVALVVYHARQRKLPAPARHLPYAMVAVILVLAVIGPASYLKTLPAIATANLAGGMALLGLTWLLHLHVGLGRPAAPGNARVPRLLAWSALWALAVQILLGVWLSANFAAASCSGFLACASTAGAGPEAFWYLRELHLTPAGAVDTGAAQALMALAHQLGAVVCVLLLVALGLAAVRAGGAAARWGAALAGLVILQAGLGITALTLELPLAVVMGHDLVAALLLLAVLRLLPATPERPAPG